LVPHFESTHVSPDPLPIVVPTPPPIIALQPMVFLSPETTIIIPSADPPTRRPIQTCHCGQPPYIVHVLTPAPDDIIPNSMLPPLPDSIVDLSIAIQKGIRPTQYHSPFHIKLCYHCHS
jgi:hypothetical protein